MFRRKKRRKEDMSPKELYNEQIIRILHAMDNTPPGSPEYTKLADQLAILEQQAANNKATRQKMSPYTKSAIATGAVVATMLGANAVIDRHGDVMGAAAQRIGQQTLAYGLKLLDPFRKI